MIKKCFFIISFAAILTISNNCFALSTIDQQNNPSGLVYDGGPSAIHQQEVKVGLEGDLLGVDIFWSPFTSGGNSNIDFYLYQGVGPHGFTETPDFYSRVTLANPNDWNHIDVTPANLSFLPGSYFVFGLNDYDRGTQFAGSYETDFADFQYHDGLSYIVFESYTNINNEYDIAFRTHVNTTVTPEPASMALFGLGAAALGLSRRNRRKK